MKEYPRLKLVEPAPPDTDSVSIQREDIVWPVRVEERLTGSFAHLAYYLGDEGEWLIGRDDRGHICLVCLRRDPT